MNLLVFHCDRLYTAKHENRLIDARIEHQRYSVSIPPAPLMTAAEEAGMIDARRLPKPRPHLGWLSINSIHSNQGLIKRSSPIEGVFPCLGSELKLVSTRFESA